jgi:N-acyl-D-aspartate/D-glutamate deacylase
VREQNLLSLPEAVRKMSGLAAETFQLRYHGKIEDGYRANIVVFNPHHVIDCATFEDSRQFPEGIEHVIVEGEVAIRYGESYLPGTGKAVRRTEND